MTPSENPVEGGHPRRLPSVFYNPITVSGALLAVLSLTLIAFLFALEALGDHPNAYVGILAFVVMPVFLLVGLGLIAFGALREWRRRRRGVLTVLPRFDLNVPSHRRVFIGFSAGTVLLFGMSAFGSFQAYEYTESNEFCGTVCHTVMHPEYTTYAASPHSNIRCAECHIGPGADWFVRSKLTGAYQVYAAAFDRFPRPIPTPIESLRPARDTCEQCHRPTHFLGERLEARDYYASDETNSHVRLHLLLPIGGVSADGREASGIHWHVHSDNRVEYVASDDRRLEIPWVRVRRRDGSATVYRSEEADLSEEALAALPVRTMDCIDCHNRPSHNFHPPRERLNALLASGRIDASLPSVKAVLLEALEAEREGEADALEAIAHDVSGYYAQNHPELVEERGEAIQVAITQAQDVYRRNVFPVMKADWKAFPDHAGHLYAPGCFRCHDAGHVTEDGTSLAYDCNGACHSLLSQENGSGNGPGAGDISYQRVEFQHPVDIDGAWQFMKCSECHDG